MIYESTCKPCRLYRCNLECLSNLNCYDTRTGTAFNHLAQTAALCGVLKNFLWEINATLLFILAKLAALKKFIGTRP